MTSPAHLLDLVRQQNAAAEENGSAQARRAWEQERTDRWAGLEPGQRVWLTPQALAGAQGRGERLHLPPDTPCRLLRVDVDRGLALVLVECPNEGPNTVAQECSREQILTEPPEATPGPQPPARRLWSPPAVPPPKRPPTVW